MPAHIEILQDEMEADEYAEPEQGICVYLYLTEWFGYGDRKRPERIGYVLEQKALIDPDDPTEKEVDEFIMRWRRIAHENGIPLTVRFTWSDWVNGETDDIEDEETLHVELPTNN